MPAHTRSGAKLTHLILEIFRVNGLLLSEGDRLTKGIGLTSARWQVMGALVDGPHTVPQIARRMGLARQSVLRLVDVLSVEDIVEYSPNPDHRRSRLIRLTTHGRRKLAAITETQAGWANELGKGLTESQLADALELLQALRDRLQVSQRAAIDD